ncbi:MULTISPECIES: cellulase family glycosylhydrolase [Paenibacillus]|uniref:cellulase family glycosylhydrolase n=1 Tax=Paenibacillus TaxID=44249 RepID=UPI0022B8E0F1|nr:cellulase family glycosylhydrolase [Paenibacillus caseinilyticus]MCZ8522325.1 cellulase family glycosylhydrolase [Paenibacillus caseinilyticus]
MIKKTCSTLLAAALTGGLLFASLFPAGSRAEAAPAPFNDLPPLQLVKNMAPGWNLGNTLDAIPTEGSWNNAPVTEADLDMVRSAGFNSIRIPVTWTDHMGAGPDYTIDAAWMARVEQVVDWSLARGFYVMLNVHHDSWQWAYNMPGNTAEMEKFKKVWSQIAARFKDKNEKLVFEIINEPKQTSAQMNTINTQTLPVIRSSGGNNDKRLVVLSGEGNNIEKTLSGLVLPSDSRVAVDVHYYPYQFTTNSWNMPVWNMPENKAATESQFQQLHDKYVAAGVPVILGEYAMMSEIVYGPEARFYMDHTNKTALKNGIVTMFWDDGYNAGFDRVNKRIKEDRYIPYILKSAAGVPNSFVWPAEFYIKADEAVKDFTASLDLSGNTLTGVYNGSSPLAAGTDYTVSGTTFTLKASFLNRVLNPSVLGQNAQLTFKFSKGQDNIVNVNRYKAPTVAPLTIDKTKPFTADVVLPFNYNGVKIKQAKAFENATGAAVDTINSWTTWLEGGGDYVYDNQSTVTLRKDFANMFDTNSTVRFELWPEGTVDLQVNVGTGSGGNTGNENNAAISPVSASFDKNAVNQADVPVALTLNGHTLSAIRSGSGVLAAGTDYTVSGSGSSVKLLKTYLAKQPVGSLPLTFDFSGGADPVLTVAITDTTGTGGLPPAGSLKVQMMNAGTAASANTISPQFKLVNTGTDAVSLANVKLRYYYTADGTQAQNFSCDWSQAGCANIGGTFVKLPEAKPGADTYVEIGFGSGAGTLAAGQSLNVQTRINKSDWSNYTQTGDYSFNAAATAYADWTRVTSYLSGALQWGVEP